MENIDYNHIKIVGIVEAHSNHSKHATINAVGYLDSSWEFFPLSQQQISKTFPSRGCVFAPNFLTKHSDLVGKCIFAGLQLSANDGTDKYVWDRDNGEPDEYGTVITNSSRIVFSENPSRLYVELQLQGYLDLKETTYFRVEKDIYILCPKTLKNYYIEKIPLQTVLSNEDNDIVTPDNEHYVSINGKVEGGTKTYIDIMPDELLKEWFVKNFLAKEWGRLLTAYGPKTQIINDLLALLDKAVLPSPVFASRKGRLSILLTSFLFTFDEIRKLMDFPNLAPTLEKSINNNFEEYLKRIKGKHAEQLETLKLENQILIEQEQANVDTEVSKIKEKVNGANLAFAKETAELEKRKKQFEEELEFQILQIEENKSIIKEQQDTLHSLEENKDSIVNNFGVVKDVMEILSSYPGKSINADTNDNVGEANMIVHNAAIDEYSVLEILEDETVEIGNPVIFVQRLSYYLSLNNRKADIARKLFKFLTYYKAIVVPDNRILHALLKATGRCCYTIQYVTPEWRSFSMLWENGLKELVESCYGQPNMIHYCVLENINLSYLPCYLQPIVDMSIGMCSKFPKTNLTFPSNLRFLLTTTSEEGLPLAQQSIRYFGCLENSSYVIDEEMEFQLQDGKPSESGYLSPSMLLENKEYASIPSTEYLSYLVVKNELYK